MFRISPELLRKAVLAAELPARTSNSRVSKRYRRQLVEAQPSSTKPRTVDFVDAPGADWQADTQYAGWHLGEVASGADDVLAAIDRVFERNPDMIQGQEKAMVFAFGRSQGALKRASHQLLHTLRSL